MVGAGVMDFAGSLGARADFQATVFKAALFEDAVRKVAPLVERVRMVPDFADSPDRDALLALALAFTRGHAIEVERDPLDVHVMRYPLLVGVANARATLEPLAEMGLLERRLFDQAYVCAACGSLRTHAQEVCPACKSVSLRDASAGAGEGESGRVCAACGAAVGVPAIVINCADCGAVRSADQVRTHNWYHYDLNEDGETAALAGRLPAIRLEDVLKAYAQAHSARDFTLIVTHGMRCAARYKRPYGVMELHLVNADEIRQALGPKRVAEVFGELIKILTDMLRTTDLVAARSNRIFVALPETKATQDGVIMWRLKNQVTQGIKARLHLECKVSDGEKGLALLQNLQ